MIDTKRLKKFEGIEDQHYQYWRRKISIVVKISKEYGHSEFETYGII